MSDFLSEDDEAGATVPSPPDFNSSLNDFVPPPENAEKPPELANALKPPLVVVVAGLIEEPNTDWPNAEVGLLLLPIVEATPKAGFAAGDAGDTEPR